MSRLGVALDRRLNKPYYLFRPRQLGRRAAMRLRSQTRSREYDEITSPWGLPLRFRANEQTGLCYARRGIFDLPVCEALWRLVDPGELAIDVGANVGQMTSVLAAGIGGGGRVIAFEPHPELFRELAANVARWNSAPDTGAIQLRQVALSSTTGVAELGMGDDFAWNAGTASIAPGAGELIASVEVPVRRLDDEIASAEVGVMKLDVEGHELEVLQGAKRLLAERRIRDIVFEEFAMPPTPVTRLLEGVGYAVFGIDQALLGPLVGPASAGSARRSRDDPSYVATADPGRALARMRRRGWRVLGLGRRPSGSRRRVA
jgi:FkbM family methyltransferase